MIDFLKYCWLKVQNGGNIYANLNNCHICFFMSFNYKYSFFCFVAIKMTVKVLGNY